MGAIGNVTVVLAAAVADDATFTAPYPTGVTRNMLLTSSGGRMVVNGDAAYAEGASGFTVAYGASSMTITNTTGASLAAGSSIVLSFGEFPDDGVYNLAATDVLKIAQDGTWQELTASGVISPLSDTVELNHISVVIAATLDVALVKNRIMVFKDTSASGTAAHTVTLTNGTFNGTNTIATFNARDEFLIVHFDSAGRGQVIANVGSVALS
jgi:hypothetical protein